MSYDFEVVILTTAATGTPHASALQGANPGLAVHVHVEANAATAEARNDAWRNCDRNLRTWWKAHRMNVQAGRVLVMEWDVFCNVDLRPLVPRISRFPRAVAAPEICTPIRDERWPVFSEIPRLPRDMQAWAIGGVPFALMMVPREVLDGICEERWDGLFAEDIFCELRFPTLCRYLGYQVTGWPAWADVTTTPRAVPDGYQGVMHPVKTEVVP